MMLDQFLISSETQIPYLQSKDANAPFEACCDDKQDTYKVSYRV